MLGYVLKHTQAAKIQYVGHSMGTTAFMAMSDYHQEIYDRYVRLLFGKQVGFARDQRNTKFCNNFKPELINS